MRHRTWAGRPCHEPLTGETPVPLAMQLARIDGVVTSTVCHPSMRRTRTVICQPLGCDGADEGPPVLAVDFHGAGLHQRVIFSTDGSETRRQVGDEHSPLRNLIVAIVDQAGVSS